MPCSSPPSPPTLSPALPFCHIHFQDRKFFKGFFAKVGKKATRAVLWVSADGLRVVDDKTKSADQLILEVTSYILFPLLRKATEHFLYHPNEVWGCCEENCTTPSVQQMASLSV
ncbi:hypothetical protein ATANTOWER_026332 [Ataeniobius toweri]|uniref:Uncharacterized protein n=1 Tax=Ataeniobius toweri TaxID=208326 RepID=A0ABU7BSH7_9TELE|nr:hypothetical protein [Ataeniobius toweri]